MNNTTEKAVQQTAPKKSMSKGVRSVLCAVFTILLAAVCAFCSAGTAIRIAAKRDNVREIFHDSDFMFIPLTHNGAGTNLYEIIFYAYEKDSSKEADIRELVRTTNLSSLLAEKACDYADFILYGGELAPVDSDMIKEYFGENHQTLCEAFGTEIQLSEIQSIIDEHSENFSMLTAENIEESVPAIGVLRFVCSSAGVIVSALLTAVIALLIGIISGSPGTPLVSIGASLLIPGITGTLLAIAAVRGTFGLNTVTLAGILFRSALINGIQSLYMISAFVITAGLILIITGIFAGKLYGYRRGIMQSA